MDERLAVPRPVVRVQGRDVGGGGAAVVVGVRWLRRHGAFGTTPTPLEILRARYAHGELTRQDFESMRRDLDA